jgi:hypothetical protein
VLTLTLAAVVALAAASIYATCKAWSAVCRRDLVSWMCWTQVAKGLGALVSCLIASTD